MLTAAIVVAFVALAGLLACGYALHRLRKEQRRRLRAEVGARIGNHGICVGAWLIGIVAEQAEVVKSKAVERAGPDGHKQILDLWARAGGRVLSHVTGPEVVSEAEACGWLAHASDALAGAAVTEPFDHGREAVFALVYASTTAPPTRTRNWSELRAFVGGPGILGAAFVACPGAPGRAPASWRWTAIGSVVLLFIAFVAAALALAIKISPDPTDRAQGPTGAPTPVPSVAPPPASTSVKVPAATAPAPPGAPSTTATAAKPGNK